MQYYKVTKQWEVFVIIKLHPDLPGDIIDTWFNALRRYEYITIRFEPECSYSNRGWIGDDVNYYKRNYSDFKLSKLPYIKQYKSICI
jgi:hypothetical protein